MPKTESLASRGIVKTENIISYDEAIIRSITSFSRPLIYL